MLIWTHSLRISHSITGSALKCYEGIGDEYKESTCTEDGHICAKICELFLLSHDKNPHNKPAVATNVAAAMAVVAAASNDN